MSVTNIPIDIKNDVMALIDSFYQKFNNEAEKLKILDIIESEPMTQEEFYNAFLNCHNEIRQDAKNRARYFILKKTKKLHSSITNELPEHSVINQYCIPSTVDSYWDTLFHSYVLLESCMEDKDQSVITTIVNTIDETTRLEEERLKAENDARLNKELLIERKAKIMEDRVDKMNVPDIKSLLSQVKDPKISKMLNELGGKSGMDIDKLMQMAENHTGGGDLNNMLKGLMGENKEAASVLSTLMDSFNDTDGSINIENIGSILSSVVPSIDQTCHVNAVLIEKMYNDILYIYEKKTNPTLPLSKRVTDIVTKYIDIVKKGCFSPEELIGCIWKVATDEDKQQYLKNMEKEDIDAESIKAIIKKFVPRNILRQIPVDVDAVIDTIFEGNFADIGSLMDVAKNFMTTQTGTIEEDELTEEQMAELEAQYDRMMASFGEKETETKQKKSKKGKKGKK